MPGELPADVVYRRELLLARSFFDDSLHALMKMRLAAKGARGPGALGDPRRVFENPADGRHERLLVERVQLVERHVA